MVKPVRGLRWYIGGLFFLSTVITTSTARRFSVLAPYLQTEFAWSNADFALIIISFRVAYAFGQTGAGRCWTASARGKGLSLGVAFYSFAAMITSLASGLRSFCACRFLLGAAKRPTGPVPRKACRSGSRAESGWAVALFDSGSSIGGAVAPCSSCGSSTPSGAGAGVRHHGGAGVRLAPAVPMALPFSGDAPAPVP